MNKFKVGISNKEVVDAFRTLVADKTQISQNNGWSPRLIYFYLLRYRARLIRERVRRNQSLSSWNYQTIDCIPLVSTDTSECPCNPKSGCIWLKTKYPIPKPLHRLKSVTSDDGQITYNYSEWERLKSKINSRFKAQNKKAFYTIKTRNDGTYLYLYNKIHTKTITLTGIFENPLQIQYYPGCDGKTVDCPDPMNEEFILDPDLLPLVYDLALNQLLRAKQLSSDILNDDNDNITSTKLKIK